MKFNIENRKNEMTIVENDALGAGEQRNEYRGERIECAGRECL